MVWLSMLAGRTRKVRRAEAKITGMTPAWFTLIGRYVRWPP